MTPEEGSVSSTKTKLLATMMFVLATISLFADPVLPFPNEPEDFRGIKWGASINEIPDMVLVEDAGDLKFYERKNENRKIGSAIVDTVSYGFYKNRFFWVQVLFNGGLNFPGLKQNLTQLHGKGTRLNQREEEYFWFGDSVTLYLVYRADRKKGEFWFAYEPIRKEKEGEQEIKKGAK